MDQTPEVFKSKNRTILDNPLSSDRYSSPRKRNRDFYDDERGNRRYSNDTGGFKHREFYSGRNSGGFKRRRYGNEGWKRRSQQKIFLNDTERLRVLIIKFAESNPFNLRAQTIETLSDVILRDTQGSEEKVNMVVDVLIESIQSFPLRSSAYSCLLKFLVGKSSHSQSSSTAKDITSDENISSSMDVEENIKSSNGTNKIENVNDVNSTMNSDSKKIDSLITEIFFEKYFKSIAIILNRLNSENKEVNVTIYMSNLKLMLHFLIHCCNISLITSKTLFEFLGLLLRLYPKISLFIVSCSILYVDNKILEKAAGEVELKLVLDTLDKAYENFMKDTAANVACQLKRSHFYNGDDIDSDSRDSALESIVETNKISLVSTSAMSDLSLEPIYRNSFPHTIYSWAKVHLLQVDSENSKECVFQNFISFKSCYKESVEITESLNPIKQLDNNFCCVSGNVVYVATRQNTSFEIDFENKTQPNSSFKQQYMLVNVFAGQNSSVFLRAEDLYRKKVRNGKTEEELPLQGIEIAGKHIQGVSLLERYLFLDTFVNIVSLYGERTDRCVSDLLKWVLSSDNPEKYFYLLMEGVLLLGSLFSFQEIFGVFFVKSLLSKLFYFALNKKNIATTETTNYPWDPYATFDDLVDAFVLVIPSIKAVKCDYLADVFSFLISEIFMHSNINYTRITSPECTQTAKFPWAKWDSLGGTIGQIEETNSKLFARVSFVSQIIYRLSLLTETEYLKMLVSDNLGNFVVEPASFEHTFENHDEQKLEESLSDLVKKKPGKEYVRMWLSEVRNATLLNAFQPDNLVVNLVRVVLKLGRASYTHLCVVLERLQEVFLYAKNLIDGTDDSRKDFTSQVVEAFHLLCFKQCNDPQRTVIAFKKILFDLNLCDVNAFIISVMTFVSDNFLFRDFIQSLIWHCKNSKNESDLNKSILSSIYSNLKESSDEYGKAIWDYNSEALQDIVNHIE